MIRRLNERTASVHQRRRYLGELRSTSGIAALAAAVVESGTDRDMRFVSSNEAREIGTSRDSRLATRYSGCGNPTARR
jgi:hypothetical protein